MRHCVNESKQPEGKQTRQLVQHNPSSTLKKILTEGRVKHTIEISSEQYTLLIQISVKVILGPS